MSNESILLNAVGNEDVLVGMVIGGSVVIYGIVALIMLAIFLQGLEMILIGIYIVIKDKIFNKKKEIQQNKT